MKRIVSIILIAFVSSMSFAYAGDTNEVFLPSKPELSPDGSTITFSWQGDICTAPTTGGTIKFVSKHPAFEYGSCFSPDGSKIAFTSNRTGSNQIYTIDTNGGSAEQITFHTAGASIMQWPGKDKLLFAGVRDYFWRNGSRFFTTSATPSYKENLMFDAYGRDGRLSPDGSKMIFVREGAPWYRQGYQGSQNGQIWTYDIPTEKFELLLGHDGDYDYPAWGENGNKVYYSASFDDSPKNLWEYDLVTGVKRQMTNFTDGSVINVVASNDGSTVVFRKLFDLYSISTKLNSTAQKIKLSAPDEDMPDKTVNLVSRDASDSAFTSDALEIAFVSERDIWVMDTELKEPVPVYNSPMTIEKNLVFNKDNTKLYFLSDDGIHSNIYCAVPANPEKYWWQNSEFTVEPVTALEENIESFSLSPDEKMFAFQVKSKGLWLADIDGSNPREFVRTWDGMDYAWSPKSTYIAYTLTDVDIRSNIWIEPVDKSSEPYNVTRNPRYDSAPAWSPDGKYLVWTGTSFTEEVDIFYVPLQEEIADKTDRDLIMEKAIKLMKDKRKAKDKDKEKKDEANPESTEQKQDDTTDENVAECESDTDTDTDQEVAAEDENDNKEDEVAKDIIDFENLYKRVKRIKTTEITESCPIWVADNKLVFNQNKNGNERSYYVEFPDKLNIEKYSDTSLTWSRTWLKDAKKIAMLRNSKPSVLDKKELTQYSFETKTELSRTNWYELGFKVAWRYMSDGFYSTDLLKKAKWDQMLDKYIDKATNSPDGNTFGRVINLMLGELNASHMGFTSTSDSSWHSDDKWHDNTAHLGARFDQNYTGPGLKVRDILPGSPADLHQSRLYPNDIITHIDGIEILPNTDIYKLLTASLDRDIALKVKNEAGEEREVTIRPEAYNTVNSQLKQQWMDNSKEIVKENSDDKLGYVYIARMMWDEFVTFEKEIFTEGEGKDGMIIDVRGNGGGFTADNILTVLCQPAHAYVVPRGAEEPGYTSYRRIYNTWDKPIVVLCDQDSFSNAEIFSHAIKTLKRGKLVGVPTAGGVISTGSRNVVGIGDIRMPFIGWYPFDTGLDMELNGAIPDVTIWPTPGDVPAGKDQQLEKAIEVLQQEVKDAKKKNIQGKVQPIFMYE